MTKNATEKKATKETTFTPGPWDVSRWGKACFEIQGGSKSLAIVNKVQETRNEFLEKDASAKQRRNESTIEEPNYDTTEAIQNARLMAAAPDLLEALNGLVDVWHDYLPHKEQIITKEYIAKAKAAIAKCEGK